jgi:hypothetical protein
MATQYIHTLIILEELYLNFTIICLRLWTMQQIVL